MGDIRTTGPSSIPVPRPRPQLQTDLYTVKPGDSLWKIAENTYGDGMQWQKIYAHNQDVIGKNPDLIQPGMQLKLITEVMTTPAATPEAPAEPAPAVTPDPPAAPPTDTLQTPAEGSAAPVVELVDLPEPQPAVEEAVPVVPAVETPVQPAEVPEAPVAPAPESPVTAPLVEDLAPAVIPTEPLAPVAPEQEAEPVAPASEAPVPVSPQPPEQPLSPATDPAIPAAQQKASGLLERFANNPTDPALRQELKDFAQGPDLALLDSATQSQVQEAVSTIAKAEAHEAAQQAAQQQGETLLQAYQSAPDSPEQRAALKAFMGSPAAELVSESLKNELQGALSSLQLQERKEQAAQESSALLSAHQANPSAPEHRQALKAFVASEAFGLLPPEQQQQLQQVVSEIQQVDQRSAKAEQLLSTIDGKGYTASHHGDPVGGIPQVARAMDELLAFYNSGEAAKLPAGPAKDKISSWAQEIVGARLATAARRFDGVSEAPARQLLELVKSPAFASLPEARQDQLLKGLRSGYELSQQLPQVPLKAELAEALGPAMQRLFPAPPTPQQLALQAATQALENWQQSADESGRQALEAVAKGPHFANLPADLQTQIQGVLTALEQADAEVQAQAELAALQQFRQEAQAVLQAFQANPSTTPTRERLVQFVKSPQFEQLAPELQTAIAQASSQIEAENQRSAKAAQLLSTIDGKGYTASHHGDPVGGIPQVARAMDELLAFYNSGEAAKLPAGAAKDKINSWAQEIVSARTAKAAQRFTGFVEAETRQLLQWVNSPAFQALPPETQQRVVAPARMGYELLAPALPLADEAQQALAPYFAPAAEANPAATTASASPLQPLQETLDSWTPLGIGAAEKSSKLFQQSNALWEDAQTRREMARLLSDKGYLAELATLLAQRSAASPEQVAELLSDSQIQAVKLLEKASDQDAGQILTALAQVHQSHPQAAQVISQTLAAYDGTFWDREAPFKTLQQSAAFQNLPADLKSQIEKLLR